MEEGPPLRARVWMSAGQLSEQVFAVGKRAILDWFRAEPEPCPFTVRRMKGGETRGASPVEVWAWIKRTGRSVVRRGEWVAILDGRRPAGEAIAAAAADGGPAPSLDDLARRVLLKAETLLKADEDPGAFQRTASGIKALSSELRQLVEATREAAAFSGEYMRRESVEATVLGLVTLFLSQQQQLCGSGPEELFRELAGAGIAPVDREAFTRLASSVLRGLVDQGRADMAAAVKEAEARLGTAGRAAAAMAA